MPVYYSFDLLQLVVTAYDSLATRLVATATVTIHVTRNPSTPIFELTSYQTTITEYYPIGQMVLNITATDPDSVCINLYTCIH